MAIRQRFPVVENFRNTVRQCWHLGVTAFGGPPVHFKIVSCEVWRWNGIGWDEVLM